MKSIISKKVLALYPGGGLLQKYYYETLEKRDPYSDKEDTGDTKRTVLKPLGPGSNYRQNNPGAGESFEEDDDNSLTAPIGSGYNNGGGVQEQDAISDGTGEAEPYDINGNELFRKLDVDRDWARDVKKKTDKLLNESTVMPTNRYDVDLLLKGKK